MKKTIFTIILTLFIFTETFAVKYNSDPKIFIEELVNDAIKTLSDKSISKEEKAKIIKKIALENVDVNALGLYTLGDIRKSLDKSTLNKYNKLFESYFLKTLTSRLTDYSQSKFDIIGADQKNAKYTIVNSKIAENTNQTEIKIDWRVYTKDPNNPLIRDLIVEGLSLAKTQKEEFLSILNSNNNNIDFLFFKLEEFVSN